MCKEHLPTYAHTHIHIYIYTHHICHFHIASRQGVSCAGDLLLAHPMSCLRDPHFDQDQRP